MSFVHLFHIELRSHAEEAIAIEAQMALPVIRHEIRANYHPEQQSSNIGKYVRAAIQPVYHLVRNFLLYVAFAFLFFPVVLPAYMPV